jgi:hypothetical protein
MFYRTTTKTGRRKSCRCRWNDCQVEGVGSDIIELNDGILVLDEIADNDVYIRTDRPWKWS